MSKRDKAEKSAIHIPEQRGAMKMHREQILAMKRQSEIKLLAQSLHWVARHSEIGYIDMARCERIAEFVAGSGTIRRLVMLDNLPITSDDFSEIGGHSICTVQEAIRALDTEVAHQWRGRRVPSNPLVHADGVRDALRRLEDSGSQG